MPYISPFHFSERMSAYWRDLSNIPTPALQEVWKQMAWAFGKHVLEDENCESRSRWTVLQPPTGTGKTLGTALYAAMLAPLVQQEAHPGVLILKTMTSEVDALASTINDLAGLEGYAQALHSALPTRPDPHAIRRAPVLCSTHAAYKLALGALCEGSDETAAPLLGWERGARNLVIIDECLEPIEVVSLRMSKVGVLKASIPPQLFPRYPAAIGWIDSVIDAVESVRKDPRGRAQGLLGISLRGEAHGELKSLKRALMQHFAHERLAGVADAAVDAEVVEAALKWFLETSGEELFYVPKGNRDELAVATLAIPDGIKGAVVLDATAGCNAMYRHYPRVNLIPKPPETRSYANVHVHVSAGHATGKVAMRKAPEQLLRPALEALRTRLKGRRTLVITHKDLEPSVRLHAPDDLSLELTHWGAVTGSNDWRDCDAVVMLGLPKRPDSWGTAVLRKLGVNLNHGDLGPLKRELLVGQTITDLVQGINRIRCRKVVDEQGGCESCDVYLAAGSEKEANLIVDALREQMPGIQIGNWGIRPTSGLRGRKRTKAKSATDAVIHHFQITATESLDRAQAEARISGLDSKAWEAMAKDAKKDDSYTVNAFAEAGLRFVSLGVGKPATVTRMI